LDVSAKVAEFEATLSTEPQYTLKLSEEKKGNEQVTDINKLNQLRTIVNIASPNKELSEFAKILKNCFPSDPNAAIDFATINDKMQSVF